MVDGYIDIAVVVVVEGQIPVSFVESQAVGKNLYCWICSILGIGLAELDADIVFTCDRRVIEKSFLGEVAAYAGQVLSEGCSICISLQRRNIKYSVPCRYRDGNGYIQALFSCNQASEQERRYKNRKKHDDTQIRTESSGRDSSEGFESNSADWETCS